MIRFILSLFSRRIYPTVADLPDAEWKAYLNLMHCNAATSKGWMSK